MSVNFIFIFLIVKTVTGQMRICSNKKYKHTIVTRKRQENQTTGRASIVSHQNCNNYYRITIFVAFYNLTLLTGGLLFISNNLIHGAFIYRSVNNTCKIIQISYVSILVNVHNKIFTSYF